jgi:phosphoribosyl-ATP pyrophosphohydrolase
MTLNIEQLFAIIQQKAQMPSANSYTYQLFSQDISRLVQKIGEEGVEVTIAGLLANHNPNAETKQNLINEACDLLYHLLILLARNNISLQQIYNELYQRNNIKNV